MVKSSRKKRIKKDKSLRTVVKHVECLTFLLTEWD